MLEYVLVYGTTRSNPDRFLMIEKQRPEWMKGLLNLIGGKIEEGEDAWEAAHREFIEETGMDVSCLVKLGVLHTSGGLVHVLHGYIKEIYPLPSPEPGEEKVSWHHTDELCHKSNTSQMIRNLPVVISLCAARAADWEIIDRNPQNSENYIIQVKLA